MLACPRIGWDRICAAGDRGAGLEGSAFATAEGTAAAMAIALAATPIWNFVAPRVGL